MYKHACKHAYKHACTHTSKQACNLLVKISVNFQLNTTLNMHFKHLCNHNSKHAPLGIICPWLGLDWAQVGLKTVSMTCCELFCQFVISLSVEANIPSIFFFSLFDLSQTLKGNISSVFSFLTHFLAKLKHSGVLLAFRESRPKILVRLDRIHSLLR